jgi:hypothetical protein
MQLIIIILVCLLSVPAFGASHIVFDGDSLTYGTGSSNPATKSYSAQMSIGSDTKVNTGTAGELLANNTGAARVLSSFAGATPGLQLIVVFNEGINDIASNDSSANIITYINTYIATIRAAYPTAKIVGFTITKYVGMSGTFETRRQAVNTHILNDADFDYTIDIQSDTRLSDPSNTTYYDGDGVHRTDAGYLVVAQLIQTALANGGLTSPIPAFYNTYYVDYDAGNDSNNGTSTSTPWKFAPGMYGWTGSVTLSAGDVVVLKGGVTWSFTAGTTSLWTIPTPAITIMGGQRCGQTGSVSCNSGVAWGSGYPVLDGLNTNGDRMGIEISSKRFVTIDGIRLYRLEWCSCPSAGGAAFYLLGTIGNLTIKNCQTEQTGVNIVSAGPSNGSSNILFYSNIFIRGGRFFLAVDDANRVNNVQIYDNEFRGPAGWCGGILPCETHGDGIMIGSACTGTNNCLTNVRIYRNKFFSDWAQGATALIYLQNGGGSGGSQYGGNHAYIYNNQLAIDTDGAISPAYIYIWSLWNDVKIYNNTFGGYLGGSHPTSTCVSAGSNATNIELKNNIFSGCVNGVAFSSTTWSTLTSNFNFYSSDMTRFMVRDSGDCRNISACQTAPFSQEANGITGDPKFVTAPTGSNSGNWQLQSSSTAINTGTNLGNIYIADLLKFSRSGTWDIGAYEYGAGLPSSFSGTTAQGVTIR